MRRRQIPAPEQDTRCDLCGKRVSPYTTLKANGLRVCIQCQSILDTHAAKKKRWWPSTS